MAGELLPSQVAKMLGITTRRLAQLADEGKISFRWVGNIRVYKQKDVEAFRKRWRKWDRP